MSAEHQKEVVHRDANGRTYVRDRYGNYTRVREEESGGLFKAIARFLFGRS